jgi:predicted DNA-binding transcriptional regulator AlpA
MQSIISQRPAEKRALRVNDFCDAYGVSRATVYKMMKKGALRTVLIGGRRVVPVEVAETLLREGSRQKEPGRAGARDPVRNDGT